MKATKVGKAIPEFDDVVSIGKGCTYVDWKHVPGVKRGFWLRFVWHKTGLYFFVFKRYWRVPFWPKKRKLLETNLLKRAPWQYPKF